MGGIPPEDRKIHTRIYRIRRAGPSSLSVVIPRELVAKYGLKPNQDLLTSWNDYEPAFKVVIPT